MTTKTVMDKNWGVLREHTVVERKAQVGELIEVTDAHKCYSGYHDGEQCIVSDIIGNALVCDDRSSPYLWPSQYVVLVPTDIVVIAGVRYRAVERMANKGENVMLVRPVYGEALGTVCFVVDVSQRLIKVSRGMLALYLERSEYVVLSAIFETAASTPKVGTPRYNEVQRNARVGEMIKIVDPQMSGGQYDEGSILVVARLGGWEGSVYVDGIQVHIRKSEYVVLEPVASAPAKPEPQYHEVKRHAQVGEKIKIVAPWVTRGKYDKDSVMTVESIYEGIAGQLPGYVLVGDGIPVILPKEYVVLVPYDESVADVPAPMPSADEKPVADAATEPRLPKVGDKIRVTNPIGAYNHYKRGDILTVKQTHAGHRHDTIRAEGIVGLLVGAEYEVIDLDAEHAQFATAQDTFSEALSAFNAAHEAFRKATQ